MRTFKEIENTLEDVTFEVTPENFTEVLKYYRRTNWGVWNCHIKLTSKGKDVRFYAQYDDGALLYTVNGVRCSTSRKIKGSDFSIEYAKL